MTDYKDGDTITVNGKPCRIEGGALVPVVKRGPLGGELKDETEPKNYERAYCKCFRPLIYYKTTDGGLWQHESGRDYCHETVVIRVPERYRDLQIGDFVRTYDGDIKRLQSLPFYGRAFGGLWQLALAPGGGYYTLSNLEILKPITMKEKELALIISEFEHLSPRINFENFPGLQKLIDSISEVLSK